MSIWTRRLVTTGALLATFFTGLGYCQPDLAAAVGLDWRGLLEHAREKQRQAQREQRLDSVRGILTKRMAVKETLVTRLLAREMTLFEVAAWFGYLNDNPPECRDEYRSRWAGKSDEEKLCRQVIAWAETQSRGHASPLRGEEEVRRLEKELDQHIARHGRVVLPEL